MSYHINIAKKIGLALMLFSCISCKKLIEVDSPITSTNSGNVYRNDATAAAVLTGIYARMSNQDATLNDITAIGLFTGLSADELTLFNLSNTNYLPFYKNDLIASNEAFGVFWKNIYPIIFIANSAIEGVSESTTLTPKVKQQLMGEAKFIRAFCYFYLVNLYGKVPLVTSTDWKTNANSAASPTDEVYRQIVADLLDAKNLLNVDYVRVDAASTYPTAQSAERVRPNSYAASALLSRVYLYTEEWAKAETEATRVISNSTYYSLPTLNNVFSKNSPETIWSLQPVKTGTLANTSAGGLFILPITGPNNADFPIYLSDNLAKTFESGDQRKTNWLDSVRPASKTYYFAKKYKIGKTNTATQEYIMVLRLAEQYFIRAESRAQLNNTGGALADLNTIRGRANIGSISIGDKSLLINEIQNERQKELFTEWGDRWFNLKRTGAINAIMSNIAPQKGGIWAPFKALYPIPQSELQVAVGLSQNSGY